MRAGRGEAGLGLRETLQTQLTMAVAANAPAATLRAVGVDSPLLIVATSSQLLERVGVWPGERYPPRYGDVDRNSSTLDAECDRWMSDCGSTIESAPV